MSDRTVLLEEMEPASVVELLRDAARQRETILLVMADGEAVEVRPARPLKPLLTLEGAVPTGWKDAAY